MARERQLRVLQEAVLLELQGHVGGEERRQASASLSTMRIGDMRRLQQESLVHTDTRPRIPSAHLQ